MRKPLIAGNWKMNGSLAKIAQLIAGIKQGITANDGVDMLVIPTFVHLQTVRDLIGDAAILLGAQNLYIGEGGAFTGEVSGTMLKELGCQFVLIGHSERRTIFKEDLTLIALKFKAAVDAGLKPILCVGETHQERASGKTEEVIRKQIQSVLDVAGIDAFSQAVIAYEPVWAIGTGLTASPEQAEAVHAFIRGMIRENKVDIGETIRILYGGSMKPDNAVSLLAMPDIDGGLIGAASLDADSFLKICKVEV